jgi:hypothetical protein
VYVSTPVGYGEFAEMEHVFTLPATTAYDTVTGPMEIRIVAFGAQYDWHFTSLTAFKLTQ